MDERRIIDRRCALERRATPEIGRLRIFGVRHKPNQYGEMLLEKKGDWVHFTLLNEANMRICKLGIEVQDLEQEVQRLRDLIETRSWIEFAIATDRLVPIVPEKSCLQLIAHGDYQPQQEQHHE